MGILSDTVMRGGSFSFRPGLHSGSCLNRKQNKFNCTVCTEICTEQVFSLDPKAEIKWSRCRDCGLCVTACPARVFTLSPEMQRTLTDHVQVGDAVVIACEQEPALMDRKVRCLAGVPWELLALLTFYGELVLYTKHCGDCDKNAWVSRLHQNLDALKTFLGEDCFRKRVHLVDTGEWAPETAETERELSRREIFSGMNKRVKKDLYRAAVNRIPALQETEPDGLGYRRLLSNEVLKNRERIQQAKNAGENTDPLPAYSVPLPAYNTACFGCSICERICPQKAIEIKAEEGGTRMIYITPWRCTACSLCVEVCPHGGLNGLRDTAVPHLEKLPLVRVKTESCEQCGVAIKPGSIPALCPACKAKKKRLHR